MRSKENPMLVSFDTWDDCVQALKNEYTLSFKDLCKILKCSRSWAMRYLKPHLHYIYLANGAGKSPNYVRAASSSMHNDISSCTWYSKKEFKELINRFVVDISRQTIKIPIEKLIIPQKLDLFREYFIPIEKVKAAQNIDEYYELIDRRNEVMKAYATCTGLMLWEDEPTMYKRTATPAVKCDPAGVNITQLLAVHDLKDYGDSDEEIYRILFNNGAYRLVLQIPDSDGVISEKIYYKCEPLPITDTIEWVLVKYVNYLKLLSEQ